MARDVAANGPATTLLAPPSAGTVPVLMSPRTLGPLTFLDAPAPLASPCSLCWRRRSFFQRDASARGQNRQRLAAVRPRHTLSRVVRRPTSDVGPPRSIHARGRVIAIGDLHGDLAAASAPSAAPRSSTRTGGGSVVTASSCRPVTSWTGATKNVLVEWLDRLAEQAKAAGGAIYRVRQPRGHERGRRFPSRDPRLASARSPTMPKAPSTARAGLYRPAARTPERVPPRWPMGPPPGGHPVVLQVNDSIFVHGGLLPQHLRYGIARLNAELSAWMRGTGPLGPMLSGDDAPYWVRTYGHAVTPEDCRALDDIPPSTLRQAVVGHTPQEGGISFACSGRVARIDVSAAYGNHSPQVTRDLGGHDEGTDRAHPRADQPRKGQAADWPWGQSEQPEERIAGCR